jgi:hypothetical protein
MIYVNRKLARFSKLVAQVLTPFQNIREKRQLRRDTQWRDL